MSLKVEKGIGREMCRAVYRHAKQKTKKTINNKYNKDKKSSYFMYLDRNNLYHWETSQKLPANGFK